MERSAKCFGTLVALFVLGLAGTAHAAWEAPQQIDTTGEDRGDTVGGEIADGANGLSTIVLFQNADPPATVHIWLRRAADATDWSLTKPLVLTTPTGDTDPPDPEPDPELEANDAGTAGVALHATRHVDTSSNPNPTAESDVRTIFGGGWPSDVEAPPALKQLLGDNSAQATDDHQDVDVDGNGVGHVVAIMNPPGTPGPPPSDPDPEPWYGEFNTATNAQVGTQKHDFVYQLSPADPGDRPMAPASNPHIDVNEDGAVAISFVAQVNPHQSFNDQQQPGKHAVYVARKEKGKTTWDGPKLVSQTAETDDVTDHDVAIDPAGNITVVFAASPEGGNNKLYSRRWLAGAPAPRPEDNGGIEFVSSSNEAEPEVSNPKLVSDDAGNLTVAWREGTNRLFSAERTTNWTLPQPLSTTAGDYDLAVDTAGTATIVYVEGTALKGRQRPTGKQWGDAETISTTAVSGDVPPRVDSRKAEQADAFFVQKNGTLESGYASRFTGGPPNTPIEPPKVDTEDCPGDINVVAGDDAPNTLTGTADRDSIIGRGGDDTASGQAGDDCIRGDDGNDKLAGDDGNDSVGGGEGNDRITGGNGNDNVLSGGGGDDSINGNAGDDVAFAGDGNDTVDGADGDDKLSGEAGDDTIRGGAGNDVLGGFDGNDTLYGSAGRNALFGGLGDDHLFGGPNQDALVGEDGNDTLNGGAGPDSLAGLAGDDHLKGGKGLNALDGGDGNDVLRGGSSVDRLLGGAGRDRLFGSGGRDSLFGGAGKDKLDGGKANDKLYGGAGGDRIKGGKGKDRIKGGKGNDKIAARDGKRDRIDCGKGKDRVVVDRRDRVRHCEKVRRPKKK